MSDHPEREPGSTIKWAEFISFALESLAIPAISDEALNAVASYYFRSLNRLNEMAILPSIVGDLTSQIQRAFDHAEIELDGKLPKGTLTDESNANYEKIAHRALVIYNAYAKQHHAMISGPDGPKHFRKRINNGTRPVMLLSDSTAVGALTAMMSSYVTGSWTAFETLAGDLWETAINKHPRGLAELKGSRNRISTAAGSAKTTQTTEGDKDAWRSVPLRDILRHEYKIHDKMGSVLRADRRFDSLSRIREAYSMAFHKHCTAIDTALSAHDLDKLSAIRNVIIHKAGKIDSEYLEKAAYLSIPQRPIGDQIPIDGEIVPPILIGVRDSATALIKAVDEWIAKN